MVISHNLMSMNIFNNLSIASFNKSKSMEKLSTGYRINRASDDAAGLSISEKMRGQIRGLKQASRNAQDGISLLQTAEGGMSEIESILQRCRELSVQSANDTNTDDDRANIQEEVTQLVKEVDSIADYTEFNSKPLLSGRYDKDGKYVSDASLDKYLQYVTTSGGLTDTYSFGGNTYASAMIDFSNINSASDIANLVGKGISYTCCTCSKTYSIKFVDGSPDTTRLNVSDPVMEVDVSSLNNGTDLVNKIIETAYGQTGFIYDPTSNSGIPTIGTEVPATATSFVTHYSQLAADSTKLYIYDDRPSEYGPSWPSGDSGVFNLSVYGEDNKVDLFSSYNIQVGSNAGQSIKLNIPNMTAEQLGIDNLSVSSRETAESSIASFDHAIDKVSKARSSVGASQNRLEYAVENADNTAENLQDAESRIRDVDIAEEMMRFSKFSLLEKVSESLLAQANQMPNGVLNLLQ